jgi:HD-GYP domain-containing protein (c-di-GMP phosphodiesterase class II)
MGLLLFIIFTGLLLVFVLFRLMFRKMPARAAAVQQPQPEPRPLYQGASSAPSDEKTALEEKMRLEEERDFVFKLNEQLSLVSDVRSVATTIVDEVRSFLNLEVCSLYLYDSEKGQLRAEAVSGVVFNQFTPLILRAGESITGEVARTRLPVMINDLASNSFYSSLNSEAFLKNSCMSVPLIFKDELIGVINAANKRSAMPFRDGDKAFLQNVARIGAIAFKTCRLIAQMHKNYLNTITTLALLIDARDSYTKRHSENVTRYSVAIAGGLLLPPEEIEMIRWAGLLHDIGKIGIRDSILLKPGKLSDEEFLEIQSHAAKGSDIVATLPALQQISFLVRHHHERYNGTGYPDRIKGMQIELGARILGVSDAFDAMTTDRPYRKALSLQDAVEEMKRCSGEQFDPLIVECFLQVLEKNPGLLTEGQVPSPACPARSIP